MTPSISISAIRSPSASPSPPRIARMTPVRTMSVRIETARTVNADRRVTHHRAESLYLLGFPAPTVMLRGRRSQESCSRAENAEDATPSAVTWRQCHTPAARTLRRHCATSAVALPARHQVDELVEQVQRVVRARGGLRVVLDAEHGQLPVLQPLHRLVVQVDVRHAEGGRAQYAVLTVPPDGEAMVLRRDLDRAVAQPSDGMVPGPVAVEQLVGLTAPGARDQLVAETDPEYRDATLGQRPDRIERLADGVGVAGSVRDEEAVRLHLEHGLHLRCRRKCRYTSPALGKQLQRVALHAEVVGEDVKALGPDGGDLVRLRRRHAAGQVQALHARVREDLLAQLVLGHVRGGDTRPHGARTPQVDRERAGIDAGEPDDARGTQI